MCVFQILSGILNVYMLSFQENYPNLVWKAADLGANKEKESLRFHYLFDRWVLTFLVLWWVFVLSQWKLFFIFIFKKFKLISLMGREKIKERKRETRPTPKLTWKTTSFYFSFLVMLRKKRRLHLFWLKIFFSIIKCLV